MRRLPIRWRLTLLYALLMTLVLTAAGMVLFAKFSADIFHTVDLGLRSRAETVEATAGPAGANFGEGNSLIEPDVAFTQILGPDGAVLDSSSKLDTKPLLSPQAVAGVDSPTFWDAAVGVGEEPISARLLAVPTSDGAVIVVENVFRKLAEQREDMWARSPLSRVDDITTPLLVIQGAIFVVCVLAFRRGIVGELAKSLRVRL